MVKKDASSAKSIQQFIGYVIGTQQLKTVKVRVPKEIYLPKFSKTVVKHSNYLARDETEKCLIGDVVRIVRTPRMDANMTFAVAEKIKSASTYIDPQTNFVYTNGHLTIPVGYRNENGEIRNRIPAQLYEKMGLL